MTKFTFLDTIASVFTMSFVMLFFWVYAKVHYRKTHERRIPEAVLEEKLEAFAESNKETLLKDNNVSLTRYRPLTRDSSAPVISCNQRDGKSLVE